MSLLNRRVPSVSVIVPTYNRSRYIEQCLDSLLGQTVPPLEVIVVDDGSTDDTNLRLQRYGHSIVAIRKENRGKSRALNFGSQFIRGEYVWFFDDDDVALPDAIEKRLEVLQSRPDLSFVFAGHYWGENGPDGKIVRGKPYQPNPIREHGVFEALLHGCYFTLQSVLMQIAAYRALGGFDEALKASEDYDLMIRLARSFPGVGIETPCFIFRQHDGTRGSEGHRYSSAQRQAVFRECDRLVGRKIRNALALEEYLFPRRPLEHDASARRAALFSRMSVMASKGLIGEMLDDLVEGLQCCSVRQTLSSSERRQCAQAVYLGYAYDGVSRDWPAFKRRVRQLVNLPGGRDALRAFARGFFHMARSYPGSLATRLGRFWAGLASLGMAVAMPQRE